MKKVTVLFSLSFILLGSNFVFAEDPVVDNNIPVVPDYNDIIVKDNCTVVDTDGVSHVFPVENSGNKFLGICALVAAKEANYINSFDLVNDPSMGLYLKNINNTTLGPSEYWALWLNGGFASCGVGCLPVAVDDKLDLILTDWSLGTESTKILLRVSSLEETPVTPPVSIGGGSYVETKSFSIENAVNFLSLNQKPNGSFGDDLYTDWVAIGLSSSSFGQDIKIKLVDYLKNNLMDSSVVTDNERHAMALMALGINPYSGTSIDYIKKITDSFDGTQFGDPSLVNDDIFALIVLKNAGYNSNDDLIIKDINYIISKQSNGSWGSIDMTAAAIQSLSSFESISGVSDSISKAKNYLIENEGDGSFGNPFSASWVLQSDSIFSKTKTYLISKQQNDGGVGDITDDVNNRIWSTSYAIPAILNKPWSEILNNFSKLIIPQVSSGNTVVEKKIENPVVIELPKVEVDIKKEEPKKVEEIKSIVKENIKKQEIKKPIIKSVKENVDTKNSIEQPKEQSLPKIKQNIFIEAGSAIAFKIKALFNWLLVSLGF